MSNATLARPLGGWKLLDKTWKVVSMLVFVFGGGVSVGMNVVGVVHVAQATIHEGADEQNDRIDARIEQALEPVHVVLAQIAVNQQKFEEWRTIHDAKDGHDVMVERVEQIKGDRTP